MEFTSFETAIKNFLDNHAKEDPTFAQTYAKPNKSISECCKYICQEVDKSRKKSERCVAVTDEEVFGLAIHYYDEDNIVVDGPKTKVETVQSPSQESPGTTEVVEEKRKPRKPCKPKAEIDPNIPEPLEIPIF